MGAYHTEYLEVRLWEFSFRHMLHRKAESLPTEPSYRPCFWFICWFGDKVSLYCLRWPEIQYAAQADLKNMEVFWPLPPKAGITCSHQPYRACLGGGLFVILVLLFSLIESRKLWGQARLRLIYFMCVSVVHP